MLRDADTVNFRIPKHLRIQIAFLPILLTRTKDKMTDQPSLRRRLHIQWLAFCATLPAFFCLPSSAAVEPGDIAAGVVQQLQGDSSIIRQGVTSAISLGEVLQEGDEILVVTNGAILVKFVDGARLLVRQNTRVKLSQIVNTGALDKIRHSIALTVGAIRYVTGDVGKSRPQNVAFNTPTATIGIRGTDIEIVHTPKLRSMQASGTYVRVNRGEIELGGNDGSTVTLAINEQAFAGAPVIKTRGGKSEPAVKKIAVSPNVFASGELDSLLESR